MMPHTSPGDEAAARAAHATPLGAAADLRASVIGPLALAVGRLLSVLGPLALAVGLLATPRPASAQQPAHDGTADHAADPSGSLRAGAHGIVLVTHARPALAGRSFTEGYVTQPMLSATATIAGGLVVLRGIVNLEGATLRRGELNAGIWGEGYIDRRHPHTYIHELVAVAGAASGATHVSLTGGRGFVPFGTDDPMSRPFVKYPANHHLAQILERWLLVLAARHRPVGVELALLNGDEPTSPTDLGRLRRFGDSWSARLTLWPANGLELQTSIAGLRSPELAGGAGADQQKWSTAARWHGRVNERLDGYVLAEWANTQERERGQDGFAFRSWLGETSLDNGTWRAAARLERTRRPEEERGFNAFRTPRPHAGPLLGITEWTIATLNVRARATRGALGAEPFAEIARLRAREVANGIFEPAAHYGSATQWSLSLGVRVLAGAAHARMGRYGAAADTRHREQH